MNPAEEALSDACAFAIARGLSLAKAGPARPYDYMIRGLKFGPRAMIGGERKEQEFDILGVRIDPFEVDCFEADCFEGPKVVVEIGGYRTGRDCFALFFWPIRGRLLRSRLLRGFLLRGSKSRG